MWDNIMCERSPAVQGQGQASGGRVDGRVYCIKHEPLGLASGHRSTPDSAAPISTLPSPNGRPELPGPLARLIEY